MRPQTLKNGIRKRPSVTRQPAANISTVSYTHLKEPLERFVVETAIKVIFSDEIIEQLIDLIMEAQQQENTRLPCLLYTSNHFVCAPCRTSSMNTFICGVTHLSRW